MSNIKVSDLPPSPGVELLKEAEKRGFEVLSKMGIPYPSSAMVFQIGLAEIIAEIKAKQEGKG